MSEKRWENRFRTTMVCIDGVENGAFYGRLMNPSLAEPITFHGVMPFLKEMEKLLDSMNFPTSFTQLRTFGAGGDTNSGETGGDEAPRGKLATFGLRVLFRQNASWQGSLSWLEGKQEESFRSVLELLFLMDSVFEKTS